MPERLPREFFDRPSTEVAPDLLGSVLWHDTEAGLVAVRLTEVEAYQGASDPASHAYRGETARNAVMFGEPGHAYVYFTYGMHFCVNVVCQPVGLPEAVLLRAGEVVAGADLAARRRSGETARPGETQRPGETLRPGEKDRPGEKGGPRQRDRAEENGRRVRALDLARGPARLCQALGIDRDLDGADFCGPDSPLGIGPPLAIDLPPGGVAARPAVISTGPRVGISRAADRPWRYWLAGDGYVSVYRPAKPRSRTPRPVTGSSPSDGTMHR